MTMLIRLGAYILSGLMIWDIFQSGKPPGGFMPAHSLALNVEHSMVFGVCAGFSQYTGIDVTIIRLIWGLAVFYRGLGLGLYLLAFLIMPSG